MERLASHLLLNGGGGGDIGSTNRIFLQFAGERNLMGGMRSTARARGAGLHGFRYSPENDADDALQHG